MQFVWVWSSSTLVEFHWCWTVFLHTSILKGEIPDLDLPVFQNKRSAYKGGCHAVKYGKL